jgi:hypothetical protein
VWKQRGGVSSNNPGIIFEGGNPNNITIRKEPQEDREKIGII